jgi:hypothetical protein
VEWLIVAHSPVMAAGMQYSAAQHNFTAACEWLWPMDHSRHGLERGAHLNAGHTRFNTKRTIQHDG